MSSLFRRLSGFECGLVKRSSSNATNKRSDTALTDVLYRSLLVSQYHHLLASEFFRKYRRAQCIGHFCRRSDASIDVYIYIPHRLQNKAKLISEINISLAVLAAPGSPMFPIERISHYRPRSEVSHP